MSIPFAGSISRRQGRVMALQASLLLCLLCSIAFHSMALVSQQSQEELDVPFLRGARVLSTGRKNRFPSVEERIKIYMSNWYVPPCSDGERTAFSVNTTGDWPVVHVTDSLNTSRNLALQNVIEPDQLFWLDRDVLKDCARPYEEYHELTQKGIHLKTEERIRQRGNMNMYCSDALEVISALEHLEMEENYNSNTPILLQFGDMKHSHVFKMVNVPHIKKFRSGASKEELERVTSGECHSQRTPLNTNHHSEYMAPIIWKLATHRHYNKLPLVEKTDIPWDRKLDKAIFRGQLTGALESYDNNLTDEENCQRMKRCRLVLETANSKYIDAKLTTTRKRLSNIINGTNVVGPKVSITELLKYKGIVMMEGNDVASGLKWALLSQSVVLMPAPRHTSWAMEELLEPWVHYVPLNDDITDVEEKMKWVVDHPREAQEISRRGTLWMEDMEFHPDAKREERIIKEEIMRRYLMHFREV